MSDSKDAVYRTFNILRIIATTTPPESNETGTVYIHVTLMRLRITTDAVEKQYVLHILSLCL